MNTADTITALLNRLSRVDASDWRSPGMNAAQAAVLDYLSRANRFSRSPSHVADYLGTTRGTMSQSLKSLVQKGLVSEERSETDKRSISYHLTDKGGRTVRDDRPNPGIGDLSLAEARMLEQLLRRLLQARVAERGFRPFGICKDCIHHEQDGSKRYCRLLGVSLQSEEALLICHEQEPA